MNEPSLTQRLHRLPGASRAAFSELLALGHLSADDASTILDGAELSGVREHALAFAVAYQHLRQHAVPVNDVIRMARQRKMRINIRWSKRAWHDAHARLARAATLDRLSAACTPYPVEAFRARLPAHWPGYLIRDSRRLGMEGLRQRHCVASYHQRLLDGQTAIAVVFLHRTRWTVELQLHDDALRIAQIRTRLNGIPEAEVRRTIHECLAIAAPAEHPEALLEDRDEVARFRENLPIVLDALHRLGVVWVAADFDGSGDSGVIERPIYQDADGDLSESIYRALEAQTVRQAVCVGRFHVRRRWMQESGWQEMTLTAAVEAVLDHLVMATGVDWYNNDGGWGEIRLNVPNRTHSLEINTRFTESECEVSRDNEPLLD